MAITPRVFMIAPSSILLSRDIETVSYTHLDVYKRQLEEFDWAIEGQDCRDETAYYDADRAGRGIPFSRERRAAVWRLYEVYRDHLAARDLFTWGGLTQAALDRVRSGAFKWRWDYVVVDEAQDLTPAALALAVELCREPSGVFLTADANQSLYNRGFHWNRVHAALSVTGRTRLLGRNYRSTRQIAAAAAEIVAGVQEGRVVVQLLDGRQRVERGQP